MQDVNWIALIIFVLLFGFITWLGFAAAHWRKGDLDQLHEWGLGGRRFGTVITWFLVGGDLYTAYTFIAVPALAFGAGAIAFFAVPYTIVIYPILFLVFPRLWHVCHKHGYITAGDFVRGRFGNRWLALAVTITGIVATMPYIALQLVGMQVVIGALGISGTGLCRRPAADHRLRHPGRLHLFERPARAGLDRDRQGHPDLHHRVRRGHRHPDRSSAASARSSPPCRRQKLLLAAPGRQHHRRLRRLCDAGARLGAGAVPLSALDHRHPEREQRARHPPQRRDAAGLFVHARAAGADRLLRHRRRRRQAFPNIAAGFKQFGNNFAVPALFLHSFPSWFVGIAFAAIGIGALVPAAIMSIAAANLYTRNIHREFINQNPTDKQEAQMAKWVSLIVKFGALVFILFVPTQYAIQLQLLGGIWIIQTLPAVMLGVYTRWFNDWALLVGWAIGTVAGTWMVVAANLTPTYPLAFGGYTFPGYTAFYTVILNLAVAVVLTPVFNAMSARAVAAR